jgi:hypothetical protein
MNRILLFPAVMMAVTSAFPAVAKDRFNNELYRVEAPDYELSADKPGRFDQNQDVSIVQQPLTERFETAATVQNGGGGGGGSVDPSCLSCIEEFDPGIISVELAPPTQCMACDGLQNSGH